MTLHQYKRLNEGEQFHALEESGVLIAERKDAFCNVQLYQVDSFYVELYHHTHFNVVVNVKSFGSTNFLQPYLKSIDLTSVISLN